MRALVCVAWLMALSSCEHVPHEAQHTDCASCHSTQAADWQQSRHAVAHSNAIFQRSWADTRDPWCLSCHLPEDGVSCATCHSTPAKTCADCHEFDLPRELPNTPSGTLGQSTVSEWHVSGAAARGMDCTSCHDPHRPRGGHDQAWVRDTIDVQVTGKGDTVSATLTASGIGHAFPTGDPFRRLQLTLCADLSCTRPITQASLHRSLKRTENDDWILNQDTRIPPPTIGLRSARSLELHAPEARSWQLHMHLTDPAHAAELGEQASYVVANGAVERQQDAGGERIQPAASTDSLR